MHKDFQSKFMLLKGWLMGMAFAVLTACGGGGSSSPATPTTTASSNTYSTTSDKGDYSEWTLSGTSLKANWEVTNKSGGVKYTYTLVATCGAADANSIHQCIVDTPKSSCKSHLVTCPATPLTGTFEMMEVPGAALLVHTTSGTGGDELHVGLLKDTNACNEDVSGDYTYIRTGVGLNESFGIYHSDKTLINIDNATFGFDTPAKKSSDYTSQSLTYRGAGASILADGGCSNGLRQRTGPDGIMRAMMTASGLFILDLPAGRGGFVSFNVKKAASLADFANKSFGGIVFPDDSSPKTFHAKFGSIANNKIDFSVSLVLPKTIGKQGLNIMSLATPAALTDPAYPDFTTAPANYSSSPLAATYPTPNAIPGLFKMGKFLDRGRVIVAAMKFNNKVIAIGMTDNYRDFYSGINPSTGKTFSAPGVYNSGNFILFEK